MGFYDWQPFLVNDGDGHNGADGPIAEAAFQAVHLMQVGGAGLYS